MRIPTSLLRERITVAPFLGDSAYGPSYGEAFVLPARVEGKRRTVRTAGGDDIISSASATIRPDARDVPTQSKVSHAGTDYVVVDVLLGEGLTRPAYRELVLG